MIYNKILIKFTNHPNINNMSYLQHLKRSMSLSLQMCMGFIYLFIHAIFPFIFEKSGSNMIHNLYDQVKIKCDKDI
jgi:hypothetical protein